MTERRVLIVEDEMIVALELKETLQRLGYTVVASVDNGYDAIKMAGRLQPDVVLMDIRIRGDMDGIETAERLFSLYDVPVIYLTAHSDNETLRKAINTTPAGYLVKPVNERALYSNIEMAIHKHTIRKKMEGRALSGEAAVQDRAGEGGPEHDHATFGQEVLDALKDPMFIVDRDLRLILHNRAFSSLCSMLGKPSVEPDQHLHDLLPASLVGTGEEFGEVFSSGSPQKTEKVLKTQGKSIFIVIERIPVVSGPQVRHIVAIVHDVYEEKSSEMMRNAIETGFQAIYDDLNEIARLHAGMGDPLHEIRKLANAHGAIISRKATMDEISGQTEHLIALYADIGSKIRQSQKNTAAWAPDRT
ncbi:MAG: response regulator [Methanomicrobiaceae archaeon]|nr:response regulator [Methanomicrobiaceae archaeon]